MRVEARSLQSQLLIWLLALLIPILIIGAISSYFRAYNFSNLAYDRSLFRSALALADQVVVVQGKVVVDLPEKTLDLLEYDKDDWIYYRVTDPQGLTIVGEADLPLPATLPSPGGHIYFDTKLGDKTVRVVAFLLPLKGTSAQGAALVQVAETKSKRDRIADEIIATMMLPQMLIVLLAGLMVYYGVRWGLKPLDRLKHAIEQRSHRDLSDVPIEDSPREVQPLLHSMNDLLHRLRDSIAQQKRFTADVSHQLRTPLAGIKTQAEVALRETDLERIHHALEWIRSGTVRLSHLVNQLLALARVEPGAGREIHFQELDLAKLARDTTAEWVTTALSRQIDLGFETTQKHVPINGNALMLQELISNLLDNAVRHTPLHGKITVIVTADEDQATLMVEDNGPGIPLDEREQIFERFYRLPESTGEGCGLGLAIVREIALMHHGKVNIESGAGGGGTMVKLSISISRGSPLIGIFAQPES
jgi:two-component system sensor histidine kinase TctE